MRRVPALWLLAALAVGCTVALVACGRGTDVQPSESPVSPVTAFPWVPPPAPAFPGAPPPAPVSSPGWIADETFWTSPLPWVAIGLILFGGLGWVLVRVLRAGHEREDRSRPPGRAL